MTYMIIVSLMFDLPENNENWSITPEFKNGPIARVCMIVLYMIATFVIYKDEDSLINYRRDNTILNSTKIKYYLYNFS